MPFRLERVSPQSAKAIMQQGSASFSGVFIHIQYKKLVNYLHIVGNQLIFFFKTDFFSAL